jgi:hypothetical protein
MKSDERVLYEELSRRHDFRENRFSLQLVIHYLSLHVNLYKYLLISLTDFCEIGDWRPASNAFENL